MADAFRVMLSLDAAGMSTSGYPTLLKASETLRGRPPVIGQHPHDFLMELGTLHRRAIARDVRVELDFAAAGNPALGPGTNHE